MLLKREVYVGPEVVYPDGLGPGSLGGGVVVEEEDIGLDALLASSVPVDLGLESGPASKRRTAVDSMRRRSFARNSFITVFLPV